MLFIRREHFKFDFYLILKFLLFLLARINFRVYLFIGGVEGFKVLPWHWQSLPHFIRHPHSYFANFAQPLPRFQKPIPFASQGQNKAISYLSD